MYTIYCITCRVNGKKYIGYTKKTAEDRWNDHVASSNSTDTKFYRAIRKHKPEQFSIKVLETHDTKKQACSREKQLIVEHQTIQTGYNTHEGGLGGHTGAYDKVSKKMQGLNNHMFGKHHTESTKQKLRESILKWRATNDQLRQRRTEPLEERNGRAPRTPPRDGR